MATVYLAADIEHERLRRSVTTTPPKPAEHPASSYRVEPAGIEPATSGLQSQRSPN